MWNEKWGIALHPKATPRQKGDPFQPVPNPLPFYNINIIITILIATTLLLLHLHPPHSPIPARSLFHYTFAQLHHSMPGATTLFSLRLFSFFFLFFHAHHFVLLSTTTTADADADDGGSGGLPSFKEAPAYRNGPGCPAAPIHIAMTLDSAYLRGSVAGVLSVLRHASCPENLVFHFLASLHRAHLRRVVVSTFPSLAFRLYHFDRALVRGKISASVRRALDQPLNYARIYLADLLPRDVDRIVYLDSDLILVDDVAKLWSIDLGPHVLGAPEYCHANFSAYFTPRFWRDPAFARTFAGREPCYFNTGVMVIDVLKWRDGRYTDKLERWMRIQKRARIYELGSLPPFLLVFAGDVEGVEHRWNQHGLGGDNLQGLCRDLHPGPVSLLHWSGKGKPWLRLDANSPCPMDSLWAPYDLLLRRPSPLPSFPDI